MSSTHSDQLKNAFDCTTESDSGSVWNEPTATHEWINLFDARVVPRQVLEHVVDIKRDGCNILLNCMELLSDQIKLEFDSITLAKDAIREIHHILNTEQIVCRALDNDEPAT